jgi:hypothetical protein
MIYTENNYLRTSGTGNNFKVEIDTPTKCNLDYHRSTIEVAKEIHDNKQGKLYLMYSGGVDSEYALNIFLSLGIDVIPVVIKLNPHYNSHDVDYAFEFCKSKNLNPIIIDLDFDWFVKSGKIIDVAKFSECGAYQIPSTFYALEQLDGTVVMGSHGPTHLSKINNTWFVDEMEAVHSVLKYFDRAGVYGYPFMLSYTNEQYFSFLQDPLMQDLVANKIPGKLGNNSSKGLVYNRISGFNMQTRQKYTGYENIETRDIFKHENLQWFLSEGKKWYGMHYVPYQDLISRLGKQ